MFYKKKWTLLISPHPLINFERKTQNENNIEFSGALSGNTLPEKMKDGTYVINVDEYLESKVHWLVCITTVITCVNSYRNTKNCYRIVVFKGCLGYPAPGLHKIFNNQQAQPPLI